MELPRRTRGDELLRPGELLQIRQRLRVLAQKHDLVTVIACAFDHRTRMLPFIYADTRMVPAGVRAVGSALVDSGFSKTRIVLQQWNKNFRPSRMMLDGRVPDLFMVSTMSMHSDRALELMRDAKRIDPAHRPLIIGGGSHAVYEPHRLYTGRISRDANGLAEPDGPDVVVTGEEFVLLSLIEAILSVRAGGESMRSAFLRAKNSGALEEISGLVFPSGQSDGTDQELIDTGVQRLLGDLDELSHPVLGYRLIEAPSRSATLSAKAMEANRIRWKSPISSLVMTFGCKFACPYCPIPAYNQRQHRLKSPQRIADEMFHLNKEFGLRYFFGTDDNFFNNKARTLDIAETLASAEFDGVPLRGKVTWYTEVTVHDTLLMKEHLPLVRRAGCKALWLGVEDMTAKLVNKGQTVNKTTEAFQAMRENGICPMPMMMHHDAQPLYSHGTNYGLLNQVNILRKAGAVSLQVLMLTPSPGTKLFAGTYEKGLVIDTVGKKKVLPYMHDGNYVIASSLPRPWRKQINLLLAYLFMYNPWWLVVNLWKRKTKVGMKPAYMQILGMLGLTQNIRRTGFWALRMMFAKIRRMPEPPRGGIPIRSSCGDVAAHAPIFISTTPPPSKTRIALPVAG
jgi:radical SAM superfamily enzyme YgiQ (UPF0313 family)